MWALLFVGAPDRIRTCDPCLRRAVLYPAELRALLVPVLNLFVPYCGVHSWPSSARPCRFAATVTHPAELRALIVPIRSLTVPHRVLTLIYYAGAGHRASDTMTPGTFSCYIMRGPKPCIDGAVTCHSEQDSGAGPKIS